MKFSDTVSERIFKILSVALDSGFEGFVFEEASQTTEVDEHFIEPIQPNPMELESQTKCEWLCSRKLLMSQFEATLDGLKGDGQSIIDEFVDWENAGPTFSFNELRDALCGEAKYLFDANHMYFFGHACTGRDSKRTWTSRTIELNGIEYQKHQTI